MAIRRLDGLSKIAVSEGHVSFKRGDRVIYKPKHGNQGQWERGIVKRMSDDGLGAFVLYDTEYLTFEERDLDNYTPALTSLEDLSREGT